MVKEKNTKAVRGDISKVQTLMSSSVAVDGCGITRVQDEARAINNYAAGLSFAIPDMNILKSYTAIVDSQREALDSVLQIGERYKVENDWMTSFVDEAILPITSAVADIGLVSANITKLYGTGSINLEQLASAQNFSELAINAVQTQQSIIQASLLSTEKSGTLKLTNDIAPALQFVSSGVSEMMRSLPSFPAGTETRLPSLEVVREMTGISEDEIFDHQEVLDNLLREIDPGLVDFRKGVWVAFNGKGEDYIGQASSSMRRLVDNLLRALAPQEKVLGTKYFKTGSKAKDVNGHPTRRAKILYVINWDQNNSDHLKRLTNGFLEAYDNLSAWDHAPLQKDEFVHGALIAIEGYLISILTANQE